MKSKFLILILSIFCLSNVNANKASGFYAGVSAGGTFLTTKYTLVQSPDGYSATSEGGKSHFSGGLFVGYHFPTQGKIYIDGEIYALQQNTQIDMVKDAAIGWNGLTVFLKKRYCYGAALLAGIAISESPSIASVYLRLGVENGAYRGSVRNSNSAYHYTNAGKSKNIVSFAPGAGIKLSLSEKIFVRAEYVYVFSKCPFSDLQVQDTNTPGVLIHNKLTAKEQRFMLSLGYQF